MNKTELSKIVNSIDKKLKVLDFNKSVDSCVGDIADLEDAIRSLLPSSKVEVDIDYDSNKVVGLDLIVLVDEHYTGKTLNKDLELKRPNFSSIVKVHKGVELLIGVTDSEYSISASVCVDYKLKNGYEEKYDIITIVEKGCISLVA